MFLSLRHWTAVFILLAGVALAAAAPTGGSSRTVFPMIEATDDGAGEATSIATMLPLSDEQRGIIYEGVMRMPDAVVVHLPAPETAEELPDEVIMQDFPMTLTQDIPLAQGHKFVKFDDRIVVVEPTRRVVVAMIPRYKLLP